MYVRSRCYCVYKRRQQDAENDREIGWISRRLLEKSLSRYQYNRGRIILLNEVFCFTDQLREYVRHAQLEIVKQIVCFTLTDSLTHPESHNIVYGAAT